MTLRSERALLSAQNGISNENAHLFIDRFDQIPNAMPIVGTNSQVGLVAPAFRIDPNAPLLF